MHTFTAARPHCLVPYAGALLGDRHMRVKVTFEILTGVIKKVGI